LNARNALDSGRTGERGGGQHPAMNGHPKALKPTLGTTGLNVQLSLHFTPAFARPDISKPVGRSSAATIDE